MFMRNRRKTDLSILALLFFLLLMPPSLHASSDSKTSATPDHKSSQQNPELQKIENLMFQGKIHEAGEAIESFIKQHPRDWEGLFLQGEILSSQREYLKALKVYETLEIMDPQHLAPKNRKITLLLEMGALHLAAREMHQIGASIDPAIQHKAAGDDAVKWIHWKFPEKARTNLMQNIHILESKISPQWLAQKTGNDSLPLGPILVFLDHITESEGQGVWDTDKGRHYLRAIWDLIMAYDSEQRWNDMVLL